MYTEKSITRHISIAITITGAHFEILLCNADTSMESGKGKSITHLECCVWSSSDLSSLSSRRLAPHPQSRHRFHSVVAASSHCNSLLLHSVCRNIEDDLFSGACSFGDGELLLESSSLSLLELAEVTTSSTSIGACDVLPWSLLGTLDVVAVGCLCLKGEQIVSNE